MIRKENGMNAVIIEQADWKNIPINLIKNIIEIAKKDYGIKFISCEGGEECDENTLIGLFGDTIERTLNGVNF